MVMTKPVSVKRFKQFCNYPKLTNQQIEDLRKFMLTSSYSTVLDKFKEYYDIVLDHQVQYSARGSGDPLFIHTGTGDIYDVTLVYDYNKNCFWLGCLADYMEKYKKILP